MNRRQFFVTTALGVAAVDGQIAAPPSEPAERVDFGYAFAPPHRMTVARPEASEKTLLDVEPGSLTVSWSYDDLRQTPLAVFKTPRTDWRVKVQPLLDGKPFSHSAWKRGGGFLPLLENEYREAAGSIRLDAIGGTDAALVRVTLHNADSHEHHFAVRCEVQDGWVAHNAAWMETGRDPDALLACQNERADRVLLFGLGGAEYPVEAKAMTLAWTLAPGERREGWLVRPYRAYQAELARWREVNWQSQFDAAQAEWKALLGRSVQFDIPDEGVKNGLYACLGDIFIMREPLKDGYMGTLCGTEGYRSTNPGEPTLAAIALDQTGYHAEAANGLRVHLDMQEPSGQWAEPGGWVHHMWGVSGFKAWAAMEHFRLTGDRAYLEAVYPRMAASSRWQESKRRETRASGVSAERGLMPRGMGDCGLMNGTDFFGVFYSHNILAIFADRLSAEAAEILGKPADAAELRTIYEAALRDLRASLKDGAIQEEGYRWIPNSPGNRGGSRWGVLYALFPAGLMDADDPLLTGSLKKIERSISAGGQPVHTGWMEDGAWVGITLDNVAETHLALGNGDAAIRYLYSSLNHGTPLYTWCEERGLEPGTKKTSGDRQHLWTPVAVVRLLRDALVMEQADRLQLGLGTARSWLQQGKAVGVREAPTAFGPVSYRIESDVTHHTIRADVDPPQRQAPREIVLHLRHPGRARMRTVMVNGQASSGFDAEKEWVRLPPGKPLHVIASY
jgi:hypothetical protein